MHVEEIWRYPVKSMGGERVDAATVTALGIPGDRGWGLADDRTGTVLTGRRAPALLTATAVVVDGRPVITTADGDELDDDRTLSDWLDRSVRLVAAAHEGGTYENPLDPWDETDWVSWTGPPGAWHDSGRSRLSIVSRHSLGDWDVRRFRANIVVSGEGEDEIVGSRVALGDAVLDITKRISRCVMVTRPQPGLPRDLDVLKRVNDERDGCLSIGATVLREATIRVGDELRAV